MRGGTEEERGEGDEEEEEEEMNKEIGFEEVMRALGYMKNGKAAGEDGIVVEFLKNLPLGWMKKLVGILNGIFVGKGMVKEWGVARIFPIHKGGSEEDVKNYRGVSLLDSGYKLLAVIIEKRLRFWLEKNGKIGEAQAGFRNKRGTRDHIFVLNSIIGKRLREKGGKLYACFVDFRTAFDAVDRRIMLGKLSKIGVRGRLFKVIERIYSVTDNEIITGEGISERFRTRRGVRQGCPLSVLLFLIYLEDLEKRWIKRNEGGTVVGKLKIFCLKFADDVGLVADTAEGLRDMLKGLELFSRENGIVVNEGKTKVMVFRKGGRRRKEKWCYMGKELEVVNEYK